MQEEGEDHGDGDGGGSGSIEAVVREAAGRICVGGRSFPNELLKSIFKKLEEEYIVETWQLQRIHPLQWKELGVPIGLSIYILQILDQEEQESSSRNRPGRSTATTVPGVTFTPAAKATTTKQQLLWPRPSGNIKLMSPLYIQGTVPTKKSKLTTKSNSTKKKSTKSAKRGRPKKETPILSVSEVTESIIDGLSANHARAYIVEYNKQYGRHFSCPNNKAGRIASLKKLVMDLKKKV